MRTPAAVVAIAALAAIATFARGASAVTISNVTWTTTADAVVLDATTDQPSGFAQCGGWGVRLAFQPDGAPFAYFVVAEAAPQFGAITRSDQEGIIGQAIATAQDRALHVELPRSVVDSPASAFWQLDYFALGGTDFGLQSCEPLFASYHALAGSATLSYAAAPARTKLPARHSAAPAAHPTLGSVRARWSK